MNKLILASLTLAAAFAAATTQAALVAGTGFNLFQNPSNTSFVDFIPGSDLDLPMDSSDLYGAATNGTLVSIQSPASGSVASFIPSAAGNFTYDFPAISSKVDLGTINGAAGSPAFANIDTANGGFFYGTGAKEGIGGTNGSLVMNATPANADPLVTNVVNGQFSFAARAAAPNTEITINATTDTGLVLNGITRIIGTNAAIIEPIDLGDYLTATVEIVFGDTQVIIDNAAFTADLIEVVPEPSTIIAIASGILVVGVAALRLRRNRR